MPTADIRGARIYYEINGTGHPLVLTMGQGTGPEAREELLTGLSKHRTVLTYDQRGTGRSGAADSSQSIEDMSLDIVALMDEVGFARADVMGISTGTGMATALAAGSPGRVERLVLAAPWSHGDDYLMTLQKMRMAAASTMPADYYSHLNALLVYPPEYRREHSSRFKKKALTALDQPQNASLISARLNAILAFDARPLYARIRCPTLVLGARDDLVMPLWFAEEAANTISGARLVTFENGGHLFAETRTAGFLEALAPFLDFPITVELPEQADRRPTSHRN